MKTDFTRTGKRTHKGAIDDGVNSVTRYFINNFNDGYNHDSLDICTGKLQPSSKLHNKSLLGPIKTSLVGMVFTYVLINSFMNSYLPVQEDSYKSYAMHAIINVAYFMGCFLTFYSKFRYSVITNSI